MRTILYSVLASLALAIPLGAQTSQAASTIPAIPVERYTLPNGLTVLLSEDHSAPVIAVDVW
ncbi:MAG TPA: hypothetical protein VNU46_05955, partial [Gemmatimonadaceae bacterium]|nr:hypothetical protein [Gemmatimonadaceae bacterium]